MKIVIKLGTSTLAHSTGRINIRRVEELCKVIADLKNAGNEIILVSSENPTWETQLTKEIIAKEKR